MSLITGNKVKKTHKPRYCEKEKDKANKRILRSLSFDNNGLVKPSCGTVALYGPFGFFQDMADYLWIILAEFCKLKYSIKKLGGKNPGIMHGLHSWWNLNSKVNGIFLSKTLNVLQSLKYIFWSTKCSISGASAPWTHYGSQPNFLGTS